MMNDKIIGCIGATLGVIKALLIDPSPTFTERILNTFILGLIGSFGAIIGKKLWLFGEKLINKYKN